MKSTFKLSLILIVSLFSVDLKSQDCGCDHTIENATNETLNVINASDFDYQPGDVFCIPAGEYKSFRFQNFIGTAEAPLIFKNCDGLVDIRGESYSGLQFNGSQYVQITGTGDDDIEYGIHVSYAKSGSSGVSVSNLSSDFEIDHFEISDIGFAGITAKTDPYCDDTSAWRENFTLRNLNIHNNFIHDTHGEGMYIGSTFGYETSSRDCEDIGDIFAHLLENVKVHDNILVDCGWDGIQVTGAHLGTEIYNNSIHGYGKGLTTNQNYGIALGGGTGGDIYNNKVIQKPENASDTQRGISVINGLPGLRFFNNLVVGAGSYGIWTHIRMTDAVLDLEKSYSYYNNTIVNPGETGIFFNTCIPNGGECREYIKNAFYNNLIVNPGSNFDDSGFWKETNDAYLDFVTKELRDAANAENNLFARDEESLVDYVTADIKFANASGNDYSILEGSVAIDGATDISNLGVSFDINGGSRPVGEGFDYGAFEFGATNQAPLAIVGDNLAINEGTEVTLDGSGSSDVDGSITTYLWTFTSGPVEDVAIPTASLASATVTLDTPGDYVFTLTVTDDEGAESSNNLEIEVIDVNEFPVADAGEDQAVITNTQILLNGSNSSDSDGTIESYEWAITNGPSTPTITGANSLLAIFTPDAIGSYEVTLVVTDDQGDSHDDIVSISVTDVTNQPPTAAAGNDDSVPVGTVISLDGTGSSDSDGTIANYFWEVTSGPSNPIITENGTSSASFTADFVGTYIVNLTVTDDEGATDSDEVQIISVNELPSAVAGSDQSVAIGSPISLDGSSSFDSDGTIVTYLWKIAAGPNSPAITDNDAASASFTAELEGTYFVSLTVTDDAGATAEDELQVVVTNEIPVAVAGSDQSVTVGDVVNLDATGSSDTEGELASYLWEVASGPTSPAITDSNSPTPSFTVDATGTYVITLTVTDETGKTGVDEVAIIAEDIVNAIGDRSANDLLVSAVYPNPSETGVIKIDINAHSEEKITAELYSLSGTKLYSESFVKRGLETDTFVINTADLLKTNSSQLVLLVVMTDNEYSLHRIVLGK